MESGYTRHDVGHTRAIKTNEEREGGAVKITTFYKTAEYVYVLSCIVTHKSCQDQ